MAKNPDASADSEVDALFQLPLEEFTPARNALAKQRGKAGGPVKELQKPNVAAWAVNQLYWRDRDAYDRLIAASQHLRSEHHKLLTGKPADVPRAEKGHRDAIRAAADAIKGMLAGAHQASTPATMMAVNETLEALPSPDPPGRLTRALRPMGFEALAGIPVLPSRDSGDGDDSRKPKEATSSRLAASRESVAAKRAPDDQAARREAEKEEERRAEALAAVRKAEGELEQAQAAFDKAEQEAKRRAAELDAARKTLERLKGLL